MKPATAFAASAILLLAATTAHGASELIEKARNMAASKTETRIVGGQPISLSERPFQVALVLPEVADDSLAQFCGGVVLSPGWIITAAHCVDSDTTADEVQVLFGSGLLDGTGNRMDVRRIEVHPSWDADTKDGDLALLELAGLLRTQEEVRLATAEETAAAEDLSVSGWGKTAEFFGERSQELLGVTLPLVSKDDCNQPDSYAGKITDNMLCAGWVQGGQDACQGDSGGPATIEASDGPALAGLVSWGEGCGRAKKYGVYTRVANYSAWITGFVGG